MKYNPRRIAGLRWASLVERPDCIPELKRLPSGAKGAGLRYEKLFAKQFPQALHGSWFEYEDKLGHGYCQPDLIASLLPTCLIVFEVKYTLTGEAFSQLSNLYLPVVKAAMNAPIIGCVVVKNLASCTFPCPPFITPNLDDAIKTAKAAPINIPVLHWVGQPMRNTHPLKIKPSQEHQFSFPARHVEA